MDVLSIQDRRARRRTVRGLPPDIILTDASVTADGTQLGHYIWTANEWRLEMVCIDETVRTQVSWEAEKMGYSPGKPSKQNVSITAGRDSITFTVTRNSPA